MSGSKKLKISVFILFLIGIFYFTNKTENAFLSKVKGSVNAGVQYFSLCELHGETTSSCEKIDQKNYLKFNLIIKQLANAKKTISPGKMTITKEMMLRVGDGLIEKEYKGCYRLIYFSGVDGIYINEIVTDEKCTRIIKYEAGYLIASQS